MQKELVQLYIHNNAGCVCNILIVLPSEMGKGTKELKELKTGELPIQNIIYCTKFENSKWNYG